MLIKTQGTVNELEEWVWNPDKWLVGSKW